MKNDKSESFNKTLRANYLEQSDMINVLLQESVDQTELTGKLESENSKLKLDNKILRLELMKVGVWRMDMDSMKCYEDLLDEIKSKSEKLMLTDNADVFDKAREIKKIADWRNK